MEPEWLEARLAEGKSLEAIAREAGCSSSTVARRLAEYGLEAVGKAKHAPRGEADLRWLPVLAEAGFSIREIGIALGLSYTATRTQLLRHGLTTSPPRWHGRGPRECRKHGIELHEYAPNRFRCRRCVSEATTRARRRRKALLVVEAGGCCRICGYDRCNAALEFHHLDPNQKSFAISVDGMPRALDVLRAEVAKCVLLCRNCHAEVEAGVTQLPLSPITDLGR